MAKKQLHKQNKNKPNKRAPPPKQIRQTSPTPKQIKQTSPTPKTNQTNEPHPKTNKANEPHPKTNHSISLHIKDVDNRFFRFLNRCNCNKRLNFLSWPSQLAILL